MSPDGSSANSEGSSAGSDESSSTPDGSSANPDDLPTVQALPAQIEVEDVAASYGDETVLDAVTASVEAGELVGLVGPNGAGKTTLLRAISGALAPDAGTVRAAGDDVGALSSAASSRRIAVVPQTTHLSFAFSVRELVEMGRHPHRSRFQPPSPEDRELVESALERTRTAQFAERSIEDVSGGERQRVLLARAIAQDAPVLLLDEPTANLDLNHAVETMSFVRDLVEAEDTAALAAIHDLELAARFCDRILVLAGSEIVAAGPPETVLEADCLAWAFDARIAVEPSPIDGGVSIRAMTDPEIDRRVHVVGGGQPAAAAIGRLGDAGADLSLGPVPRGDRAVSTAAAFDAEVVSVAPFRPVDAGTRERARDLAAGADSVVLAAEAVDAGSAAWLDCCAAAEGVVVLDGTTVDPAVPDAPGGAAVAAGRAPTADLDSLPAAVEAAAERNTDVERPREAVDADELADATLADGGTDAGGDDP